MQLVYHMIKPIGGTLLSRSQAEVTQQGGAQVCGFHGELYIGNEPGDPTIKRTNKRSTSNDWSNKNNKSYVTKVGLSCGFLV